jgi:hypothetical protein
LLEALVSAASIALRLDAVFRLFLFAILPVDDVGQLPGISVQTPLQFALLPSDPTIGNNSVLGNWKNS